MRLPGYRSAWETAWGEDGLQNGVNNSLLGIRLRMSLHAGAKNLTPLWLERDWRQILLDAGDWEICRDYRGGPGCRRSDSLAFPGFFRVDGQTSRRHFSAKGQFFLLLSGRHMPCYQYRPHTLELVIQAVRGKRTFLVCKRQREDALASIVWLLLANSFR